MTARKGAHLAIRRVNNDKPDVQRLLLDMDTVCFPDRKNEASPLVDSGTWWVAYDGKKPAAYACIRPSYQRGDTAYLSRAGVLPAYRGKGLQKRLIRVRLAWARAEGYDRVVTDTVCGNVASSNSLIACGLRLFRPGYLWSFTNALYWQMDL